MELGIAGNKEQIPAKYDCSFLNKKNNKLDWFSECRNEIGKAADFRF